MRQTTVLRSIEVIPHRATKIQGTVVGELHLAEKLVDRVVQFLARGVKDSAFVKLSAVEVEVVSLFC